MDLFGEPISGEVAMKEALVIVVTSHAVLIICCFWMFGMLVRILRKRPSMFVYPWAMLPVLVWLLFKGFTHIGFATILITHQGYATTTVVLAINAVASLVACIAIRFVLLTVACEPTSEEFRTTTKALARTLGELSEKEPR